MMYSFDRFAMAKLAEAFWMDAQVLIKKVQVKKRFWGSSSLEEYKRNPFIYFSHFYIYWRMNKLGFEKNIPTDHFVKYAFSADC